MKNFLVTHQATVGKNMDDPAKHSTVHITFYTLHAGKDVEAVQGEVIQYSDPGFRTRVLKIDEVGDTVSIEDLKSLFDMKTVLTEL